jgi:hypothetical protein
MPHILPIVLLLLPLASQQAADVSKPGGKEKKASLQPTHTDMNSLEANLGDNHV